MGGPGGPGGRGACAFPPLLTWGQDTLLSMNTAGTENVRMAEIVDSSSESDRRRYSNTEQTEPVYATKITRERFLGTQSV